jgi:hypothetical protein
LLPLLIMLCGGGTSLPGDPPRLDGPGPGSMEKVQYQPAPAPPSMAPPGPPGLQPSIGGAGTRPYQPLPAPPSMAPPPPPARPPDPGVRPFGQWQREGNHFRMKPGFTGPADKAPIWVPGHWASDADANWIWVPGTWR